MGINHKIEHCLLEADLGMMFMGFNLGPRESKGFSFRPRKIICSKYKTDERFDCQIFEDLTHCDGGLINLSC